MKIVADTHALYWFFTADNRLSKRAKVTLEQALVIFIPTIVLLELISLLTKKKQESFSSTLYIEFKVNKKYILVGLDLTIIDVFIELSNKLEMHDRIIAATAELLQLPIVTKDPVIKDFYKHVIW